MLIENFEENITVLLILMHFKYQFQSALGRLMNVFMELGFASCQEAAGQRNIFHWPFLSMKSRNSEACSCVFWTLFDTSGLEGKHWLCLSWTWVTPYVRLTPNDRPGGKVIAESIQGKTFLYLTNTSPAKALCQTST